MAIKCSQDIGFDTSMPANQKEQFITEYFSMIPDSILACAFVQMPVKTISYVPELTSFYLFNIKSKETYPDLARYGVKYQIHHESLKN
jgi:hypothetical protein